MRRPLHLAWLSLALLLGSCTSSHNPTPPVPGVMFWLDSGNFAIESFGTAHPALGDSLSIDRAIIGAGTLLSASAAAMVLDPVGNRLFVANGTEILVFDNASMGNGNVLPRILRKSPDFVNVASLSLDTTRNLLYVGDRDILGVPSIYVIANASTAITPVVPVSITDGSTPDRRFVHVDAVNDVLYVADTCRISVFDVASTLTSGTHAPNRQFASCPTLASGDHPLWLDAGHNNDLYVLDPAATDAGVMVFTNAGTENTPGVAPSRTIHGFPLDIAGGARLRNVFVDTNPAHNRLYVSSTAALFILDNASTLNGTLSSPVSFPSQQLSGIIAMDLAAVAINTTVP